MPALLTAVVIVCGAMPVDNAPIVCRAQVHHGIYAEQPECSKASLSDAALMMHNVRDKLVRTSSHGECFYTADEGSIVYYLPEFMRIHMGARSSSIIHYDQVDGVSVERKQSAKIKGVSL